MAKQRVKFTFPQDLITQPVIHNLSLNYKVVTNIRRAEVREDVGWVILELEGKEEDIESGLSWVTSIGVRVDPVSGDVVEG
ncbi:MAG: NIL domain-containing protein [Chloroflexi bacterium]|nr:NIL domain-containing protein [Chloroflexota bacterium]